MTIYAAKTINIEIEDKFKPTRLAIKELNGIRYFCKTTKKNIEKYTGSGVYWKKIIKKYGKENIKTLWVSDWFICPHDLQEFALFFSEFNNIIESNEWANLILENGLDGAPPNHPGHKFTKKQLEKISRNSLSRWQDNEFRKMMCVKQKESWTEERKQKQRERLSGIKRPEHSKKMTGRKLTEEQCLNMRKPKPIGHGKNVSAALKGIAKSEEHKEKQRASIRNRSPEEWKKISDKRRQNAKPKFEIDGIPYISLRQASEAHGISILLVKKKITRRF